MEEVLNRSDIEASPRGLREHAQRLAGLLRPPADTVAAALVLLVTFLPALLQLFAPETPRTAPTAREWVEGQSVYALAAGCVIWLAVSFSGHPAAELFGLRVFPPLRALWRGFRYGLAAVLPVLLVLLGISWVAFRFGATPARQEIFDAFSDVSLPLWARGFLLFSTVMLAPVYEEALFRGLLFPALLRGQRTCRGAMLLCGLAFALIHLNAALLLPLLLLNCLLCAGYCATGSLLTPIAMHMTFNGVNLLIWMLTER